MLGSNKESKSSQAVKNDYEMFLKAFQKPTQIYKLLSYRHKVNPLFLHRNLSYMTHRRTNCRRQGTNIAAVVDKLNGEKLQSVLSTDANILVTLTGIDNKVNSSKDADGYEVKMFLNKTTFKKGSTGRERRRIPLQEKIGILDHFDNNPDKSVTAVSRELGYKACTVRLIKSNAEKLRETAALQDSLDSKQSNSIESPEEKDPFVTLNLSPSSPAHTSISWTAVERNSSSLGCMLEFRVRLRSSKASNGSLASPSKKRRCVEEWFTATVAITNETRTNLLGDGNYTLFLNPVSGESWKPSQLSWEKAEQSSQDEGVKPPTTVLEAGMSSISFTVQTEGQLPVPRVPSRTLPEIVEENKSVLMYNFLYNGNTLQQTECRKNRTCPWCSLDCKRIYSLLEHITRCHPRFKVTFIPGLNGYDELDVEVEELGVLCQAPADETSRVSIFSGPNRREQFLLQMNGSLTKTKRAEDDFMVLNIAPYKAPHTRLYFHSSSYEPVLPREFDYDSEYEERMVWMGEKTKQLIQDFTDVNEGEKAIMIMWNRFILPRRPLADHQVSGLVGRFLEEQGEHILLKGLANNFILHLTNLHSFGLLKADDVEKKVMRLYEMEGSCKMEINGDTEPTNGSSAEIE